jgi:GNAT superfamily N-acetyltransferase
MTESQDLDTHQRGAAARRCAVSRDGHRVCIRAASPEDLEPLRRMFARISPKSMYQHFFSPYPTVPGWALEHAVHVDHHARKSLVAVSGGEIVGQAMYVGSENEAEVAVVVEDAWQRRGIGTLLLAELAALARRCGIGAFTGAVLPENSQMLGLASAARARRRYSAEDGVYLIHVPLESRVRCANLAVKRTTRRGTEDAGESTNTPREGERNTA